MTSLALPIRHFKQDITPYQGSSHFLLKIKKRQTNPNPIRNSTPNLTQPKFHPKPNILDQFFKVSIESTKLLTELEHDMTHIRDVSSSIKKYFDTYYSKGTVYQQKREQLERQLHFHKSVNYKKIYNSKAELGNELKEKQPLQQANGETQTREVAKWEKDYQELMRQVSSSRKPRREDIQKLGAFKEYEKLMNHNQLKKEKPLLYSIIQKIIKNKIYNTSSEDDYDNEIETNFNELKKQNTQDKKQLQQLFSIQNNQLQSRRLYRVKQFELEKRNKSEQNQGEKHGQDGGKFSLIVDKSEGKESKGYLNLLKYYQSLKPRKQQKIVPFSREEKRKSNVYIEFYNKCKEVEKKNVVSRQEYREQLKQMLQVSEEYENVFEKVTSEQPIKLSDIADKQQPQYRKQMEMQKWVNLKGLLQL